MITCPNCNCQFVVATCESRNPQTGRQCGMPSGHPGDRHSNGQGSYEESWNEKMTTGIKYKIGSTPHPVK